MEPSAPQRPDVEKVHPEDVEAFKKLVKGLLQDPDVLGSAERGMSLFSSYKKAGKRIDIIGTVPAEGEDESALREVRVSETFEHASGRTMITKTYSTSSKETTLYLEEETKEYDKDGILENIDLIQEDRVDEYIATLDRAEAAKPPGYNQLTHGEVEELLKLLGSIGMDDQVGPYES
jgi:hypothetical protein